MIATIRAPCVRLAACAASWRCRHDHDRAHGEQTVLMQELAPRDCADDCTVSTAHSLLPNTATSSWAAICALHPDEWVCLLDIEQGSDGSILAARVVGHARSIEQALDQVVPPDPDMTVVNTSNRPLWTRRIEVADENRDFVRAHR
jgi:hypothetical protein